MPDRDTGGLTGLSGRAGGAAGGILLAAGLAGTFSSITGGGVSRTLRLGGATLPLDAIVARSRGLTAS